MFLFKIEERNRQVSMSVGSIQQKKGVNTAGQDKLFSDPRKGRLKTRVLSKTVSTVCIKRNNLATRVFGSIFSKLSPTARTQRIKMGLSDKSFFQFKGAGI